MTEKKEKRSKITVLDLQEMKENGRKITMLSIPDYPLALLADRAGLDTILVGDSLAMTVLGYETTVPITLDEMLHHAKAVTRGTKYAFVVGDMPFMSNNTSERDAIINAGRFIQEAGTDAVKVEGGVNAAHIVSAIVRAGIPVVGHIGLTPQHISQLGGYKAQGTDLETGSRVIEDALAVEKAGAFSVVLEGIPSELSKKITNSISIPTIGIGAGPHCDGQIQVFHDILGLFDTFVPKHAKQFANISELISAAIKSYNNDVSSGDFPSKSNYVSLDKKMLEKL